MILPDVLEAGSIAFPIGQMEHSDPAQREQFFLISPECVCFCWQPKPNCGADPLEPLLPMRLISLERKIGQKAGRGPSGPPHNWG